MSGPDAPTPDDGGPVAVSVVIPCYRDEENVPRIFARMGPVLDALPGRCELILVNDGSPDRTCAVATQLAQRFRHPTVVVSLLRNYGQHAAVFAGFAHARGQAVVTLDSDLQYPPEEIPRLLSHLSPETPVVSGCRTRRKDPWGRSLITRVMSGWLSRQTGVRLSDYGSMFRAYSRDVIDVLNGLTEKRRFLPALVGWLGVDVAEVPVRHEERSGRSRYRLRMLVDMLLDLVTGYSVFPLRVLSVVGLLAALLGFAGTVAFAAYRIFVGAGVSGLVTAFALLFLLAGIQLTLTVLVGEYVGRIYIETKDRPYYLVQHVSRNPVHQDAAP